MEGDPSQVATLLVGYGRLAERVGLANPRGKPGSSPCITSVCAWPGDEFTPDGAPELARAALLAARKRAQGNASAHGILIGAWLPPGSKIPTW